MWRESWNEQEQDYDLKDPCQDFTVGFLDDLGYQDENMPLCCVGRESALEAYRQNNGYDTATSFAGVDGNGGEMLDFRILVPDDVRYKNDEIPAKTRLKFLCETEYDEVTRQAGRRVLWFVPEEYERRYEVAVRGRESAREIIGSKHERAGFWGNKVIG